jgi:hypothetical protein
MAACHTCGNSGFCLSEINDGEEEMEVSIARDEGDQLEEGLSFEEYISCDGDFLMCEVQTLE